MKKLGVILAAGTSSRLYPATLVTTKQLLPIYDKPLIYYPLTTLMLAGIREVIIIVSPSEMYSVSKLFEHAETELGMKVHVITQLSPIGIADAFNLVKSFFGSKVNDYDLHALILGDNIFYGAGLTGQLNSVSSSNATIFGYPIHNPEAFGIIELVEGKVVSLEEKPINPKSNLAAVGLYFYPKDVYIYIDQLRPSKRGELEITDLNNIYLEKNQLDAIQLPRGLVWFDTGTPDSMLEASNFVHTIQKHQNYMIGSPHEIAIKREWISKNDIEPFVTKCSKTLYGKYLEQLLKVN